MKEKLTNDLSRPYKCFLCAIRTKSQLQLMLHRRMHLLKRKMSVQWLHKWQKSCKGMSKRLIQRLWHYTRKYRGLPPGKKLEFRIQYKPPEIHLAEDGRKTYGCGQCPRTFSSWDGWWKHQPNHAHEEGLKPFRCDECQKSFMTSNQMLKHRKRHFHRNFGCEICGQMFKAKNELRDHAGVHTTERNYPCQLCDKR